MNSRSPLRSFTIGQVSSRAGAAIDTIRYYEREGLIPKPGRRASGPWEPAPVNCIDLRHLVAGHFYASSFLPCIPDLSMPGFALRLADQIDIDRSDQFLCLQN